MKRGLYAFAFIVVFGSISALLTKYWDTLPAPPQSHKIQFSGGKSDPDRLMAQLLRADFARIKSQEKLPLTHETFYASNLDVNDVTLFYRKALDVPWHIAGDDDRNGRRVIIYREMFSGRMRIVAIDKRMTRDADNHVTIGTGSIVGTAEVNDN